MKRYLPLIVFGLAVLAGVFFFIRNRKPIAEETGTETLAEVPFEKRPFTSLTPSEDGHWLTLGIENIDFGAETLDYELLYKLPDGRTQGVPGTVSLEGKSTLERKLLLGSESSGKFRYDEGVEQGSLTLRFRNARGKLLGKLSTDFRLQSQTDTLDSIDGKFKFTFDKKPKAGFFVIMETFGVPADVKGITAGPYGIFSSVTAGLGGRVTLGSGEISYWSGSGWQKLTSGKAVGSGVFVASEASE